MHHRRFSWGKQRSVMAGKEIEATRSQCTLTMYGHVFSHAIVAGSGGGQKSGNVNGIWLEGRLRSKGTGSKDGSQIRPHVALEVSLVSLSKQAPSQFCFFLPDTPVPPDCQADASWAPSLLCGGVPRLFFFENFPARRSAQPVSAQFGARGPAGRGPTEKSGRGDDRSDCLPTTS